MTPVEVLEEDDQTSEAMEIREIFLNPEKAGKKPIADRKIPETGSRPLAKENPQGRWSHADPEPAEVQAEVFKFDDNDPL